MDLDPKYYKSLEGEALAIAKVRMIYECLHIFFETLLFYQNELDNQTIKEMLKNPGSFPKIKKYMER